MEFHCWTSENSTEKTKVQISLISPSAPFSFSDRRTFSLNFFFLELESDSFLCYGGEGVVGRRRSAKKRSGGSKNLRLSSFYSFLFKPPQ